jgi:hypothetical protein
MQSLPSHLRAMVHVQALCFSWLHLCLLIFYAIWVVFFFILIFTDRIYQWAMIVNLLAILSFFPFQMITPKRHLAKVFLKFKIRPSHCGFCEYDLRATEGNTCPECGTDLVPKDQTEF